MKYISTWDLSQLWHSYKATTEYKTRIWQIIRSQLDTETIATAMSTFTVPVVVNVPGVQLQLWELIKNTNMATPKPLDTSETFYAASTLLTYVRVKEMGKGFA